MEEPERIVEELEKVFAQSQDLKGKKIMITAGPTYEKIDPVRFIGNYSSGKMGYALAEDCAERGAEVTLISGQVNVSTVNPNIKKISVESAEDMYNAAIKEFPSSDAAILCAAVADFTPELVSDKKIKREKEDLIIKLKPTKDIAASLGKMKTENQVMVGFALETNDELNHAKDKLERKNLDFIVLNSLNDKGAGFRHDTNKITIFDKTNVIEFTLKAKKEVAKDIVNHMVKLIK